MRKKFINGSENLLPDKPKAARGFAESILLGMMILCDWIASGSMFADAEDWIDQEDRGDLQPDGIQNESVVCGAEYSEEGTAFTWYGMAGG